MAKIIEAGQDGEVVRQRRGEESGSLVLTPDVWAMILLDVSLSMSGEKLDVAKRAVRAYAREAVTLREWVGLMTFSDSERLIALPGPDASVVCVCSEDMRIEGGTNLTPALNATELLGEGVRVVRKVVIVTDGGTVKANEAVRVAERMRNEGFFFVTRGIPEADEEFLSKLRGSEGVGSQTTVGGLVKSMQDAARLLPRGR